jgi:hypothetical protein
MTMKFVIDGDYLCVEVDSCTCDGDSFNGHRAGCGLEPAIPLTDLEHMITNSREEWCVFYGGHDPDNAAATEIRDDENDAREYLQWLIGIQGKGIAHRTVSTGPWQVTHA